MCVGMVAQCFAKKTKCFVAEDASLTSVQVCGKQADSVTNSCDSVS